MFCFVKNKDNMFCSCLIFFCGRRITREWNGRSVGQRVSHRNSMNLATRITRSTPCLHCDFLSSLLNYIFGVYVCDLNDKKSEFFFKYSFATSNRNATAFESDVLCPTVCIFMCGEKKKQRWQFWLWQMCVEWRWCVVSYAAKRFRIFFGVFSSFKCLVVYRSAFSSGSALTAGCACSNRTQPLTSMCELRTNAPTGWTWSYKITRPTITRNTSKCVSSRSICDNNLLEFVFYLEKK